MNTDDKILELLERENIQLADKALRSLAWFIDVFLLSLIFTLIHIDTLSQMSDAQGNVDYTTLRDFVIAYMWLLWIL